MSSEEYCIELGLQILEGFLLLNGKPEINTSSAVLRDCNVVCQQGRLYCGRSCS